ncbi:MAG: PDZ domain-containing protein [candidate division WOR-3 bacterium]|nr:PDZ domain-containing protein [candidate division WOR-3 bacterium]MCR4424362.1 PDZ domain-containing protein [candidate division WOR-3 bacterium]MDH7518180.1 PDZ domain-containing protein [bacterium]
MKKTVLASTLLIFAAGGILLIGCRSTPQGTPLGSTYTVMDKPEVWKVPAKTGAQLAGLKVGDVIISYDENPIADLSDLNQAIAGAKDKTGTVKLVVLRDGKEINLEVKASQLEFIPIARRYSASLAKALEDIMAHFGQTGYYDWLAGLTTESFSINVLEEDCASWGYNGTAEIYLEDLENLTGLSVKQLWRSAENKETADEKSSALLPLLKDALNRGEAVLVWGGWSQNPYLWGIAARFNAPDSTIYGYTIGTGQEQPLTLEKVQAVYEVKCRGKVSPDPADLLTAVLDKALEQGLASTDSGWHSGLEAYDIILKKLSQFPMCPEGADIATNHFYRLVWSLISSKESANRLLEDMKEALPEKTALLDEAMARNRAIIGKLEGIAAAHLPLNSMENQQKLARSIVEIQAIENDLLGLYEEIIGEL